MDKEKKPTDKKQFWAEVNNWDWLQFIEAEHDPKYTTAQSLVFAVIRSCAMERIDAIKINANRLDGKLKTPVRMEYPKIFYLYPNAKAPEIVARKETEKLSEKIENNTSQDTTNDFQEVVTGEIITTTTTEIPESVEHTEEEFLAMGVRETTREMAEYPRELPKNIIELQEKTEQYYRKQAPRPIEFPKVKSVVAAHLLKMAQARDIDALYEAFDHLEGKLIETIQVIGEDMFITSYSEVAPEGAYLNADGILELQATDVQNMWTNKLGGTI